MRLAKVTFDSQIMVTNAVTSSYFPANGADVTEIEKLKDSDGDTYVEISIVTRMGSGSVRVPWHCVTQFVAAPEEVPTQPEKKPGRPSARAA